MLNREKFCQIMTHSTRSTFKTKGTQREKMLSFVFIQSYKLRALTLEYLLFIKHVLHDAFRTYVNLAKEELIITFYG